MPTYCTLHTQQDEFVVSERGRWVGTKRQLFLLNQRIIITKEKDADGLYLYKDQLKIQNLTLTEKEGDNPCRFGVGTGAINNWEQYYLLEAISPEKKQQWMLAIKDILKQQFELLRGVCVYCMWVCMYMDACCMYVSHALNPPPPFPHPKKKNRFS